VTPSSFKPTPFFGEQFLPFSGFAQIFQTTEYP